MMAIWALADLHLPFGAPAKSMEVFGPAWKDYVQKIQRNWGRLVQVDDLVLIPGDISWAIKFEEALIDLKWIDALPGTKVILKGNHDYWWPSNTKLRDHLPPSLHFVHNTVFNWKGVTIGGTRLWDTEEFSFDSYIAFQGDPPANLTTQEERAQKKARDQTIFERELRRLEGSLSQLDPQATYRIAMTHYPPIGCELKESRVSKILEAYKINSCIFGHLHNLKREGVLFGERNHILYACAAADYLGFEPLLLPVCPAV